MTQTYTNSTGLPLSVAVYLATDHYDHKAVGDGISATTLLKPIKQVILSKRVTGQEGIPDVAGMVSSRIGTSIHNGIKHAWEHNHEAALRSLGVPEMVIKKVVVNPQPDADLTGKIPVYLEVRTSRVIEGMKVSGEFDFVAEGGLEDHKSTGVFTFMNNTKDDDYILQGSIYRWLNPKIITKDTIGINFIFMDWSAAQAMQQPNKYPQSRILQKKYNLLSLVETEEYVKTRIKTLLSLWNAPEALLPMCTDKDLWRTEPVFKFYKDPAKATVKGARSTKNFDTLLEANQHKAATGGVGLVKTVPGQVKACPFCPGAPVCEQRKALIASGDLIA